MTMTKLDTGSTVSDWVVDRPSRSRVFEKYGIDYCCGGKRPLAEACSSKGVEPDALLDALLAGDESANAASDRDWASVRLDELCDHIEATHHAYLKSETPRLEALVEKVAAAHGPRHAELAEVRSIYLAFKAEIDAHMLKEEQILFPMIRELVKAGTRPSFHCGSVGNPIRMMELEHDSAGDALANMRRLTHDYSCPADACNTWRAMCDGLHQLEVDMHQHVHKENNILFPRALDRETSLH